MGDRRIVPLATDAEAAAARFGPADYPGKAGFEGALAKAQVMPRERLGPAGMVEEGPERPAGMDVTKPRQAET
jgi:hypothetical protein